MPIKKHKKKVHYKDTQKSQYGLDVLGSRALLVLSDYFQVPITANAEYRMYKLFKDYNAHRSELKKALLSAFTFLTDERFKSYPDDPPWDQPDPGPPPSRQTIKNAKRHINQMARKVWKK